MPRFLIELPHGDTFSDCAQAVDAFLRTGSHFLTHADWGCKDGDHRAWVVLEVENREEARNVIPPALQGHAKIVQLNTFTRTELDDLLRRHQA